jgi:hypothetical protein
MTKMVKVVAGNGYEYGEMSESDMAEARSINDMAFNVYVDFRFNMKGGENSHEDAMKVMKSWDAMMRGEEEWEE